MSRVAPASAIKITNHAQQRFHERIDPHTFSRPSLSSKELQNIAHAARYNGVSISSLNITNCVQQGISPELMRYLKSHYMPKTQSGVNKYYKGCICIYRGHKARTLISIFPLEIRGDVKIAI